MMSSVDFYRRVPKDLTEVSERYIILGCGRSVARFVEVIST